MKNWLLDILVGLIVTAALALLVTGILTLPNYVSGEVMLYIAFGLAMLVWCGVIGEVIRTSITYHDLLRRWRK